MKPEKSSRVLLSITRSKAKMFEYLVPAADHINLSSDPAGLLTLTIGVLGELSARINTSGDNDPKLDEMQSYMLFSARYFDSYRQTRLATELDEYLLLLGAASYYLCNFPGSASVLATAIPSREISLGAHGLEQLLLWLLKGDFSAECRAMQGPYEGLLAAISHSLVVYYQNGGTEGELLDAAAQLRRVVYTGGTARELLLADTIGAVVRRRHANSSRLCLPAYSKIPEADWAPVLEKPAFVYELWPAQRLLGEKGVFEGRSAIVQMPTSAGKSRATEIVVRSAFISGRASLAIIIAPFRALCHEIRDGLLGAFQGEAVNVDELSDVFQVDFDIDELLAMRSVLVVTPEKLVYVLRHAPELAKQIGLLIYDEGHQFDTGTRGVTYELLVTSLKTMVPLGVQTILISAVLPNAEAIGEWLNSEEPNVVSGAGLIPTERTVAFASWQDHLGRLEFVEEDAPEKSQFFVPRVLESHQLQRRPREKVRVFPDKNDGGTVALYLGLKLVRNGSVAIFCGRKATVTTLCEVLIDAYARGLTIGPPSTVSDAGEVQRIAALCESNLGADAAITKSAYLGVFTHHGNTPHGIRLAVEYAMKVGLVRFVVCTSTLAQGVNLPIRYLVVTSVHQGRDQIKTRDFHNLIGRAGRSGMHTEGSILFADPSVYDGRTEEIENGRWSRIQGLLRADRSEPCESTLLSVLLPLQSENRRSELPLDPLEVPRAYISSAGSAGWDTRMAAEFTQKGFPQPDLTIQISQKAEILAAVESFLMAHWDDVGAELEMAGVKSLAEGTLAYHLADDDNRVRLVELFLILAEHIARKASDPDRRRAFARTLYGVDEALETEAWVAENIEQMLNVESDDDLLPILWPLLVKRIQNATFRKCRPVVVLQVIATGWVSGQPFGDLYAALLAVDARIGDGKRPRRPTIEHVVEICENALGFEGALAVGAVVEFVGTLHPLGEGLIRNLQAIQKRIKYGLPSACSVLIYELGFADRVVASELGQVVGECSSRGELRRNLRGKEQEVRAEMERYPAYFAHVLDRVLE